jgi:MFS family permease
VAAAPDVGRVLVAKTVRSFCYGFLGVLFPVYLSDLGVGAVGVGAAVTLTLLGSAALTWAVRFPAKRRGSRAALLALTALSALAALIFLGTREPWLVVLAAMLGNLAVGGGETGPFLTVEQVVVTRAVGADRRTWMLSVWNVLGYAGAGLGAAFVGLVAAPHTLFALFLVGALVQAAAYAGLRGGARIERRAPGPLPSAPLIRRLAALFALDSFAGGFVLQSLVAYYLHVHFRLGLEALGPVFFVTQLLTAVSLLMAARVAARVGLLNTMVVTHLASNVLLMAIALAPAAWVAVGLLWARHLLSQMDVPTRQAYLMAVVEDREREAAAATTNLARTAAQAVSPALTGWVMQALAVSAPFVLGGGLKIAYDLLLYTTCRRVALRPD